MDPAVEKTPTTDTRASSLHLLRDCLALGRSGAPRASAIDRLEEALGPELTRQLLESLEGEDAERG